jgi:hypothetical protein
MNEENLTRFTPENLQGKVGVGLDPTGVGRKELSTVMNI